MTKTIHQIIPATDMYAVFSVSGYPYYAVVPLAAFALVSNPTEPETVKWVEGVGGLGSLDFVEDSPDFMSYAHARDLEDKDRWIKEGMGAHV